VRAVFEKLLASTPHNQGMHPTAESAAAGDA